MLSPSRCLRNNFESNEIHSAMMADQSVRILIPQQRLEFIDGKRVLLSYLVSTAKNGVGEQMGSECTPRGRHRIRVKIGAGQKSGAVFVARRPTGEVFSKQLAGRFPERDWILTRILWLSGLEPHRNRFGSVDTAKRYIYIHGSPDSEVNGQPRSHGCVRMRNADIIELFDRLDVGTIVEILA